jgi:hypothetical protein
VVQNDHARKGSGPKRTAQVGIDQVATVTDEEDRLTKDCVISVHREVPI